MQSFREYKGPFAPSASTRFHLTSEPTLGEKLDRYSVPGELWRAEGDDGKIRCFACGHRCLIARGRRGVCRVRFNKEGTLYVPHGYIAGAQSDPVEKKPFYHVYPGHDALTFGMLGCDFHCSYCQNWVTSQALRDSASKAPVQPISAAELASTGVRLGSRLVVSSYNEPLITAEWAVDVFKHAKAAGLACAFVSNGNATSEVIDYLQPWLCAYKVDLKSFNDRRYRQLGGTLEEVTKTIRQLYARGIWVEVVTLLISGFNDSVEEIRAMAEFLVSVSPFIPWHVTAFHPDYRMTEPDRTTALQLVRAAELAAECGVRHVYAGNAAGRVGRWENTFCSRCGDLLIERSGFTILQVRVREDGGCPRCGHLLEGVGITEARVTEKNVWRMPRPVGVRS